MKLALLSVSACLITSLSAMTYDNQYEWLENPENAQTQEWIKQQHSLFNDYMAEKPVKNETLERLKNLINFDSYSIPRKIGNNYFYLSKKSSEKQFKLCVQSGLHQTPHVVVDPNLLKINAVIESFVVSPNGNYLAYSLSEDGSDWWTCRVKNLRSESEMTDRVEKIKFSPIVWSADSQGFFIRDSIVKPCIAFIIMHWAQHKMKID